MTGKTIRLAAAMIACAGIAAASTLSFGLGGDPNQYYTFTPIGAQAGVIDTEPVGPYPGWLGQNTAADSNLLFCITFLKTANWGGTYSGTTAAPSTPQQLQAAYLGAELVNLGGGHATLAEKGAISMAIWQITDPTPGDVPRDPAAQSYVADALHAYSGGMLSAADFPNSLILIPNDPSIQEFLVAGASNPVFPTLQLQSEISGVPEPGTIVLLLAGAGLIGINRWRRLTRR
ncbi:MAG: PEP-CTERM sorting domain-containing protein [Candidatus Sulfopaludibacter sp.]|nr:PEP-CTERM sorting domain-containing protein [Candidatus Sulfopaludibacter sp.]